jgi:hypothetical protein
MTMTMTMTIIYHLRLDVALDEEDMHLFWNQYPIVVVLCVFFAKFCFLLTACTILHFGIKKIQSDSYVYNG